jgi:hypothetical protein
MNKQKALRRATKLTRIMIVLLGLSIIFAQTVAMAEKDTRFLDVKREIYYKSETDYRKLPELVNTIPENHPEEWAKKQLGVDENPRGIIGNEVVNYSFIAPKDWKVKNTTSRFKPEEDGVIFRLTGKDGIWGAIFKVDLSGRSVENQRELARYYQDNRARFFGLLEDESSGEIKSEAHLLQGFSTKGSELITQYESYSTIESSEGRFASLAHYHVAAERGYVVDIYVPSGELDERNRSTAYIIGKSFVAYRFG